MTTDVLPEIFSLTVLICLFQPIVSRVARNSNSWIFGWAMLLVYYIACAVGGLEPSWQTGTKLIALNSLPFVGLFFLYAAGNHREPSELSSIDRLTMVEMAVPLVLQSTLAALGRPNMLLERAVAVLLLTCGLHLLVDRTRRRQPLTGLAAVFAAAGVALLRFSPLSPGLAANLLLCLLFFSIAWVYILSAISVTRASVVAVIGLVGWGCSYPLANMLALWSPATKLDRILFELPQYVFAIGIFLALVEQLLARVEQLAMHDALTKLPNRRGLEQHMTRTLAKMTATRTPLALLVIDVDDFKQVNDTLGHHAGDELLRSLAVRLSWHIGPEDILARTGGDEFTAILAGVNDEHHLRFIARAMMSAASVPFIIDGESVDFSISIGLAVAPCDGADSHLLHKAADQAMYEAKGQGGGRLVFAAERQTARMVG